MDYVSISVRTQKQRGGGGERVHVLDADGFKLLPLFSIRHEAFTSLIFQTMRGGADVLGKWTVCTSLTRHRCTAAFLFSLPPQGWDVGTLAVKPELLRRLPLCSSAHPDASGGAITNPHMQSRLAMHMIPFAFRRCFSAVFSFFFFSLSIISNDTPRRYLQVEELIARVFTETPVWLERLIASTHSPFNFSGFWTHVFRPWCLCFPVQESFFFLKSLTHTHKKKTLPSWEPARAAYIQSRLYISIVPPRKESNQ